MTQGGDLRPMATLMLIVVISVDGGGSTPTLRYHGEVWDRAPLEGPGPDRARCTALRGAITSLNLMSKRLLLVTKYSA